MYLGLISISYTTKINYFINWVILIMLGVKTGKCVNISAAQGDPHKKVCEIYAWCPVEVDQLPMPHFNLT